MHELAIAKGIVDIAEAEKVKQGFGRVLEINLAVGEYSGIVAQCIMEMFPVAAEGSCAEGASLNLSILKAEFRCPECGYLGPVERKKACCPECGGTTLKMTSGRDFYVESLKVE